MNLRARNLRVGWLLAVVAMVAFAAAGRWQLGRMHEKEAMLAAADAALAEGEPQPLLLASDPGRSSAYDRARGTGRIANATVWLDSQMRPSSVEKRTRLRKSASDGMSGMGVGIS